MAVRAAAPQHTFALEMRAITGEFCCFLLPAHFQVVQGSRIH